MSSKWICQSKIRSVYDCDQTSNAVWVRNNATYQKQKAELEKVELRILHFLMGVTRIDKIKNKYI